MPMTEPTESVAQVSGETRAENTAVAGAASVAEAKPHLDLNAPLPTVETKHAAAKVCSMLDTLSKRGKLPEYRRNENTFQILAYGNQVDSTLTGTITPLASGIGTIVRFGLKVQWKIPAIYAGLTIGSLWPGMWLTDSMLVTYFDWYRFATWMWYVPLVVLPMPLMLWLEMRKSAKLAYTSALEIIEKVHDGLA